GSTPRILYVTLSSLACDWPVNVRLSHMPMGTTAAVTISKNSVNCIRSVIISASLSDSVQGDDVTSGDHKECDHGKCEDKVAHRCHQKIGVKSFYPTKKTPLA